MSGIQVLQRIGVGHNCDRVQLAINGLLVSEIEPAKAREVARNLMSAADAAEEYSDRADDHSQIVLASHNVVESV